MAEIRCPAARSERPVLSRNDEDVQCGISGRLLPAAGSPCCGAYANCRIWVTAQQAESQPKAVRDRLIEDPHKHVLDGDLHRDVARA